jgi:hypothetical protein
MRLKLTAALVLIAAAVLVPASTSGAPGGTPKAFFGIVPQLPPSDEDLSYMKAGRIGTIRLPLIWPGIQPTANGGYDWSGIDQMMGTVARARLQVLASLGSTPPWLARKGTTLPVANARQRGAWMAFVQAAVERYGPRGTFWVEHGPGTAEPLPRLPIRSWQIWNEPNFFYFAYPVSPASYAQLVTLASKAIGRADPRAEVVLAGLFGEPTASGKRGMPATEFLDRLYEKPGLKTRFDAIALHPYAVDAETLGELTEAIRQVALDNHDPRAGLYITEMGWGSQNNFNQVAFEQGRSGQVRQLRDSYLYLLENRHRLNLKAAYWFAWKDLADSCSFCDSVGLFHAGPRFKPKPAWRAFVAITGGRARP